MIDPKQSPAVQSYNIDKARQNSSESEALDQGLEDTFPASDPVSVTQTSVASSFDGQSGTDREEYPLVQEALSATGELGGDRNGRFGTLRRDAGRLSDQAVEVASGAASLGKAEAKSLIQSIEDTVRERPLTAVGIVAAVAWIWGATR